MIRGPKYKICRRLGTGVFEKCQGQKFQLAEARKGKIRGRRRRPSDYAEQLLEKQRVRFTYGLKEHQFIRYVNLALARKGVVPAEELYRMLERRLDNVVYKMGLAPTRAFARQLVSHGHIYVNGRRLNIPSYQVTPGDVISVKENTQKKTIFSEIKERLEGYKQPSWIAFDPKKTEGTIKEMPRPETSDLGFNLTSVIQFYSR